jgi:hypothetical protein
VGGNGVKKGYMSSEVISIRGEMFCPEICQEGLARFVKLQA